MAIYLGGVTKGSFNSEQLISASEVVRGFGSVRARAKKAPLLILEKNTPDSVLMSIEEYDKIMKRIAELNEELFEMKVAERMKEIEDKGVRKVPFSKMIENNDRLKQAISDIEDWELPDDELE